MYFNFVIINIYKLFIFLLDMLILFFKRKIIFKIILKMFFILIFIIKYVFIIPVFVVENETWCN